MGPIVYKLTLKSIVYHVSQTVFSKGALRRSIVLITIYKMKSLLHLVLVIVIASVLHDLQHLTTRSLAMGSEDYSLALSRGNSAGGNSVGVLMPRVSAVSKRSQRSKLIFQITIDAGDPKRKKGRKRSGKKSVRAKRRKILINRRKSKSNHEKQLDKRRSHRNHFHTLRKQYIKKLQSLLKHGNHYHKPRPNSELFRTCCPRPFGRKDMTMNKRKYGHKKPSRRRPSRRHRPVHRPLMRNSRRGKQYGRQNHRPRKTSIRRNNWKRRPATSRRNKWRRPKNVPHKHSSGRKGNQKRGRQQTHRRKTEKSKTRKVWAYDERKRPPRTKPNHDVYY